jgi:hypothetical protein
MTSLSYLERKAETWWRQSGVVSVNFTILNPPSMPDLGFDDLIVRMFRCVMNEM